ncbi:molybdopterin molybdotransferase MoeA [Aestuariivirga sp.]|uniref:molybdopterin molybdotransferase MoeA n=1 Tax=Aestuariivirga sp. TaxID=2650926 RepID=UPI0039E5E24C
MALLPVADALTRILDGVKPLGSEAIALERAADRVLAEAVVARRDQPPFPASAMDGYAVRHADVEALPATLRVAGMSAAGHGYRKMVEPGAAIRILTGAPVPAGADTVVIQENTRREGDTLTVVNPTLKGRNIRRAGLDFAKGDTVLEAGARLRPRDIGLAAAANAAKLRVRMKPRVILFTTGDELVLPGGRARPDQNLLLEQPCPCSHGGGAGGERHQPWHRAGYAGRHQGRCPQRDERRYPAHDRRRLGG